MENIIKVPLYFVGVIIVELLLIWKIENKFWSPIIREIFVGTIISLIAAVAILIAAHDFSKYEIVNFLKNIMRGS